ncbi:MAG: hypothetical protein WCT11_01460 [Candidatus Magasanikbacteria bacterium]
MPETSRPQNIDSHISKPTQPLETPDIVKPEIEGPEICLRGLKKFDAAVTEDQVTSILSTVPKGWLGEIFVLRFEGSYGTLSQSTQGARAIHIRDITNLSTPDIRKIYILSNSHYHNDYDLWDNILLHEIAHANDWEANNGMTTEEKENFKKTVIERSQAPDRYISNDVERVEHVDWDKIFKESYSHVNVKLRRATEYWAEIARVYLSSEDPKKELAPADYQLVKDVIKKTDPSHNQPAMRLKRAGVIGEIINKKREHFLNQILSKNDLDADEIRIAKNYMIGQQSETETETENSKFDGRQKIVNLLKTTANDTQKLELLKSFLLTKKFFFDFLQEIKTGSLTVADFLLKRYIEQKIKFQTNTTNLDGDDKKILEELQTIIDQYGITFDKHTVLQRGEYASLLMEDTAQPDWILTATGWLWNEEDTELVLENDKRFHPENYDGSAGVDLVL